MATWVRSGTGTAPSSDPGGNLDATSGRYALDNATAPGDFDPDAVTSVRIQWTLTGTFFTDDTWSNNGARLSTGATELATIVDGTSGLGSESHAGDGTDSTIPTGQTVAAWEAADVGGPGIWATYDQNMANDGGIITCTALTVTITYTPTGGGTSTLTPSLLSITPSFPTASVDPGAVVLTAALLSVSPSFPTASLDATASLVPSTYAITVSFPQASVDPGGVALTPALLSVTTSFPQATLSSSAELAPALLSVTATFPQSSLDQAVNPATLSVSPTFPAATLEPGPVSFTPGALFITPTFPAASIVEDGVPQSLTPATFSVSTTFLQASLDQNVTANLLSVSPSFPAATMTHLVTPSTLSVSVSFPTADADAASGEQNLFADVLSVSATMPTATLTPGTASLTPDTLNVSPSFLSATVSPGGVALTPDLLTVSVTFLQASVGRGVRPGLLAVTPSFPTAELIQQKYLIPDTLNVIVSFPQSITGLAGGPLVVSDTDAQGILQEMVLARGGPGDLDMEGCLQYLSGSNEGILGCLNILGATAGADLLKAIHQIANDGGPKADLNEITRRWALSGNF